MSKKPFTALFRPTTRALPRLFGQSRKVNSPKFALRVVLPPYHRLGRLRGGYLIRVSVNYFPRTLFWSEDHGDRRAYGVMSSPP